MQYAVGQTLWFVGSAYGIWKNVACPAEVTKVGRKWVELKLVGSAYRTLRVKQGDSVVDGGDFSSPGTLYASKEAYEDGIKLHVAWWAFKHALSAEAPKGVTLETIEAAYKLLGMKE